MIAPLDTDLVYPREPRSGAVALAVVAGLLLGLMLASGRPVPAPPSPSPSPAREAQRQEIERVREESKLRPWERAMKVRAQEGLPPWDERHAE